MILATDWATAWLMTGMGIGVVFSILILLVLVLQIFSKVASSGTVKPAAVKPAAKPQPLSAASDADKAAVAVAVYLFMNNLHDEESGKLTIHLNEHTGWHAVLNNAI